MSGIRAGLEGVSIGETRISFVDGQKGRLLYAGYDAVELSETRSFEDVWFLLHHGHLPSAAELREFGDELRESGRLDAGEVAAVLAALGGEPMASLRSAVSVLAASRGLRPWHNRDLSELAAEAVRPCGWRRPRRSSSKWSFTGVLPWPGTSPPAMPSATCGECSAAGRSGR